MFIVVVMLFTTVLGGTLAASIKLLYIFCLCVSVSFPFPEPVGLMDRSSIFPPRSAHVPEPTLVLAREMGFWHVFLTGPRVAAVFPYCGHCFLWIPTFVFVCLRTVYVVLC